MYAENCNVWGASVYLTYASDDADSRISSHIDHFNHKQLLFCKLIVTASTSSGNITYQVQFSFDFYKAHRCVNVELHLMTEFNLYILNWFKNHRLWYPHKKRTKTSAICTWTAPFYAIFGTRSYIHITVYIECPYL